MALRSISPRSLLGPDSSPTFSHRNGMARIWSLTLASSSASACLTLTRSSPRRVAASLGLLPTPQDAGRSMPCCCASALPTSPRNIEPRWFPLLERAVPRCCRSRFHSVFRLPAFSHGSDPHDAQPSARAGARFPGFVEEVDPAFRPVHATVAVVKPASPADSVFEAVEQGVEAPRVGRSGRP